MVGACESLVIPSPRGRASLERWRWTLLSLCKWPEHLQARPSLGSAAVGSD